MPTTPRGEAAPASAIHGREQCIGVAETRRRKMCSASYASHDEQHPEGSAMAIVGIALDTSNSAAAGCCFSRSLPVRPVMDVAASSTSHVQYHGRGETEHTEGSRSPSRQGPSPRRSYACKARGSPRMASAAGAACTCGCGGMCPSGSLPKSSSCMNVCGECGSTTCKPAVSPQTPGQHAAEMLAAVGGQTAVTRPPA